MSAPIPTSNTSSVEAASKTGFRVSTVINLSWMSVGTALARMMSDPVTSRMLNRSFAVLLVASVIAMAVL